MPVDLVLGQADLERLAAILQELSSKSGFAQSVYRLISSWSRFTDEAERGYADSIYEYTNDLSTRDLLTRISLVLSVDGRHGLATILFPSDERFLAAIIRAPRAIWAAKDREAAWWWSWVPRKLTGELTNDLAREGII